MRSRSGEGNRQRHSCHFMRRDLRQPQLGRPVIDPQDRLDAGELARRVVADRGLPAALRALRETVRSSGTRASSATLAASSSPTSTTRTFTPISFSPQRRATEPTPASQPALRRSVMMVSWRVGYVQVRKISSTPASTDVQAAWVPLRGKPAMAASSSSRRVASTSRRTGAWGGGCDQGAAVLGLGRVHER